MYLVSSFCFFLINYKGKLIYFEEHYRKMDNVVQVRDL